MLAAVMPDSIPYLTWSQILNLMCLTHSVFVEGLEMKGNGDLGVFQVCSGMKEEKNHHALTFTTGQHKGYPSSKDD